MKSLALIAALAFPSMMGCTPEYVEPAPAVSQANCVVVSDAEYGERTVCNTQYYDTPQGVVYYDPYYATWIGAGYYYSAAEARWYHGYLPGYYNHYRGYYRPHGYYVGHSYGGYRGYGGYHGGGHRR
jgi:hypothetical protein